MKTRRDFIKTTALGSITLAASTPAFSKTSFDQQNDQAIEIKPIVISTWKHGMPSNERSMEVLKAGGSALDAVEAGVRVIESDPENGSVGLGGRPDREGIVTLDACIMDHRNRCGAVAYLQDIEHPISVARKVMEDTPHVMLAGKGAYEFARAKGFPKVDLLTEKSKEDWKAWLEASQYQPVINIENHDTIGALAIDMQGNLSGACTTSGMAYKLHGRVGDSPIIGAGLFVDNEVGAACATGVGEAVIRIAGSAVVVELMRHGRSPQEACEEAIQRIVRIHPDLEDMQVGFLALNPKGEHGAHAIHEGFNYALHTQDEGLLKDATFALD